MRTKIIIFSLVFLFFAICVVGFTDTKSVVLRIGIWDLTEDNPIHTRAEIWIRGVGSWYFKRTLSEGELAKKFGKYPVGVKQKFFFYPESRKGKELIISFMMTEDMNPNGSVRDTLWISFYDEEVEVSGLPITAATGKSELKFKRKKIVEEKKVVDTSASIRVYITKTGSKYHRSSCSYLRRSKIPISLKDACARGYTSCSRCNPPRCKK